MDLVLGREHRGSLPPGTAGSPLTRIRCSTLSSGTKDRRPGGPGWARCLRIRTLPEETRVEPRALDYLEGHRWSARVSCPRCRATGAKPLRSQGGERNKRALWRCQGCKRQFTVRIGTVREDSPIPLRHWCYAAWAVASPSGVTAGEIAKQTGLSHYSARVLLNRLARAAKVREVIRVSPSGRPLRAITADGSLATVVRQLLQAGKRKPS